MKLIVILFMLILSSTAYAFDIDTIADFVVTNNPEIAEMQKYENSLLRRIKVDARASVFRQDISRDDKVQQYLFNSGQLLETTSTGKRFEIIVTIPLLDMREDTERRVKMANFVAVKRADVVKVAAKLKAVIDLADYLDATLKTEKAELDWLKRRVEAGVEYQKDFNAATHKYNQNLYKYYETVAQASELIEFLASMVHEGQRPTLRRLIGFGFVQAVSKNQETVQ